jgi:hypothetical protein
MYPLTPAAQLQMRKSKEILLFFSTKTIKALKEEDWSKAANNALRARDNTLVALNGLAVTGWNEYEDFVRWNELNDIFETLSFLAHGTFSHRSLDKIEGCLSISFMLERIEVIKHDCLDWLLRNA